MATSDLNLLLGSVNLPQTLDPPSGAPGSKRSPWTTLFDESSASAYSVVMALDNYGVMFQTFNLSTHDVLTLQQVAGGAMGDLFEDVQVNSTKLKLNVNTNTLFLPMAGRFRLSYSYVGGSSRLQQFQCYAVPVTFDHYASLAPLFQFV